MFCPHLHRAPIKASLLNECRVHQLCVARPESRSTLTLLICQSATYWASMVVVVVVPSLTEKTRQLFSLTKLIQCFMNVWIIISLVFHRRVFCSVSGELSDHKPFLKKPLYSEALKNNVDLNMIQGFGVSISNFYFVCRCFFCLLSFHFIDCNWHYL